ncbi:hypothetical protein [Salinicola halophyticus]|uniref:hypothetical protein n=1 Tax=Salinicola halophyticus TaxID=1808881 RepID=UPI00130033B9|nr:hypothetical protein [Salinicola halophyticus]
MALAFRSLVAGRKRGNHPTLSALMTEILEKLIPLLFGAGAIYGIPKLFLVNLPDWREKRWRFDKERFDNFKQCAFSYIYSDRESHRQRVEFEYAIKGFTNKPIKAEIAARTLLTPDFQELIRCLAKENQNVVLDAGVIRRKSLRGKLKNLPDDNKVKRLWKWALCFYTLSCISWIASYLLWAFRENLDQWNLPTALIAFIFLLSLATPLLTANLAEAAARSGRLNKLRALNEVAWPPTGDIS